MITLADFFCGAGGSSTGALSVPGVELTVGLNHWDLAVETHAANHPSIDCGAPPSAGRPRCDTCHDIRNDKLSQGEL